MVFLRSFCGLVTGPNQLWLRPAINWSQPVWTGDYCRYVAIKKKIYDYLLAAWPSLTRRGQGSSRWVTWPDTFLDDDLDVGCAWSSLTWVTWAPASSLSLSSWTTWVMWPPRRRRGSGVCMVIDVGDVAPALSSSLSMWCGCLSTTMWVTWPHCQRRGCGGCVVIVDLGSPGIVVVIVDVARHCRRG